MEVSGRLGFRVLDTLIFGVVGGFLCSSSDLDVVLDGGALRYSYTSALRIPVLTQEVSTHTMAVLM